VDIKTLQKNSLVVEMSALFRLFSCSVSGNFPEIQDLSSSFLDFFHSNTLHTHQSLPCMSTPLSTIHFYPTTCQVAHAAPCTLPQSANPVVFVNLHYLAREAFHLLISTRTKEFLALMRYSIHTATAQQWLRSNSSHNPPSGRCSHTLLTKTSSAAPSAYSSRVHLLMTRTLL